MSARTRAQCANLNVTVPASASAPNTSKKRTFCEANFQEELDASEWEKVLKRVRRRQPQAERRTIRKPKIYGTRNIVSDRDDSLFGSDPESRSAQDSRPPKGLVSPAGAAKQIVAGPGPSAPSPSGDHFGAFLAALKVELKAELTAALRAEMMGELRAELKGELSEELKAELKAELKEEVKAELKEEVRNELKTDSELKGEVKQELKAELKQELKGERMEEVKEVKQELKTELKGDVKTELRKEAEADMKRALPAEVKKVLATTRKEMEQEVAKVAEERVLERVGQVFSTGSRMFSGMKTVKEEKGE